MDRIGGWLLLFIVWSAGISTSGIVMGLLMLVGSDNWQNAIDAMLVAGISIYGGYCAFLLGKGRHEAPTHARRWLLGLAATGILRALLGFTISGEPPPGSGLPVVFALIWFSYLTKSRRVARVYGSSDAEDGDA